jgi:hypothetical protein
MATLFIICGLPGSGKTTLARSLEHEHDAVRLAPDAWMARIVGDGYDETRRAAVEAIQWELAERLLQLDVNVILEFGFWSRNERDEIRTRAARLGATVELRYLDVPVDELKARLHDRNEASTPDTFHVSPEMLDEWARAFEPPGPDELGQRMASS